MPQTVTPVRPGLPEAGILAFVDGSEAEILERTLELVARTLRADRVLILYDERTMQTIGGAEVETAPLLALLSGAGGTLVITDTAHRLERDACTEIWKILGVRFFAGTPLSTAGVSVCYLCAIAADPRDRLSSVERRSFEDFAHIAGALLDMRLLASDAMHSQMLARESELRFRTIADSAPLPIWTTGPDGYTEYTNRAWRELRGAEGPVSSVDEWLAAVHPQDRERCRKAWLAAHTARERFELEYRLSGSDGYRRVLEQAVPRFLPNGAFNGYIGCSTAAGA